MSSALIASLLLAASSAAAREKPNWEAPLPLAWCDQPEECSDPPQEWYAPMPAAWLGLTSDAIVLWQPRRLSEERPIPVRISNFEEWKSAWKAEQLQDAAHQSTWKATLPISSIQEMKFLGITRMRSGFRERH